MTFTIFKCPLFTFQLDQVAKLKRTRTLAPVLQIVQKIPENYCPCFYLSISQVWLQYLMSRGSKDIFKHAPSCTNTHHDVTDLVNHGMVKTWISFEQNIIFLRSKKILNLCLRWYILRSYRFVVVVTFKPPQNIYKVNIQLWLPYPSHIPYLKDNVHNLTKYESKGTSKIPIS